MRSAELILKASMVVFCLLPACSAYCGELDHLLIGASYTGGEPLPGTLRLSSLLPGYSLEVRSERAPDEPGFEVPAEMSLRIFVFAAGELSQKIVSLEDLRGFVKIDSVEKAVEFVRLRTSAYTFFLFRPRVMVEVHKESTGSQASGWYGEVSSEYFERHKLSEMTCRERGGHFEISRYIVRYSWPGADDYPGPPEIFQIVEKVFRDGQYEIANETRVGRVDPSAVVYPTVPR